MGNFAVGRLASFSRVSLPSLTVSGSLDDVSRGFGGGTAGGAVSAFPVFPASPVAPGVPASPVALVRVAAAPGPVPAPNVGASIDDAAMRNGAGTDDTVSASGLFPASPLLLCSRQPLGPPKLSVPRWMMLAWETERERQQ